MSKLIMNMPAATSNTPMNTLSDGFSPAINLVVIYERTGVSAVATTVAEGPMVYME